MHTTNETDGREIQTEVTFIEYLLFPSCSAALNSLKQSHETGIIISRYRMCQLREGRGLVQGQYS